MKRLSTITLTALLAVPAQAQVASLVRDITPQNSWDESRAADPGALSAVGSRLVFAANDEAHGYELWSSDGTPGGTEILEDACPGDCGSFWQPMGATRSLSFWAADSPAALWRSDGTRAGTFPVVDGAPGVWAVRGDVLFFARCENFVDCSLWRSDGTAAGTRQILDSEVRQVAVVGNQVLAATADELWKIGPGGETPVRVLSLGGEADFLSVVQGRLLMFVSGNEGRELWSSDGTAAGTRALTQFANPDPFNRPWNAFATGSRLYFVADDITHGNELWVSDGTPQGTKRISDFGYYYPIRGRLADTLQEIGQRVVFAATDGLPEDSLKLWSTDGRPESTTLLVEPCPRECFHADGPPPAYRTARAGNAVLFPAVDQEHGIELWATDGTPAGTRLFREFCPGACDSVLQLIPSSGTAPGSVHFSAQNHIWSTDGTSAGTRRLTRQPRPYYELLTPRIVTVGGKTFVRLGSDDGGHLALLQAGEVLDLTFNSGGGAGSAIGSLVAEGDRLRFLLDENELWQSAGTAETTQPVTREVYRIEEPVSAGGIVYFFQGSELWRFTADGALLLVDTAAPYGGSSAALGSQLYFSAYRNGGWEIWRTDGTAAGTAFFLRLPAGKSVGFLASSGGRLYFNQYEIDHVGEQLWTSDGTAAGTREILDVHNHGSALDQFVHAGGYDYFVTTSFDDYYQLWRTDGTAAGSRRIMPGTDEEPVRFPSALVEHQGSLYLIGEELSYPRDHAVLWRIDGDTAVRLRTFPNTEGSRGGLASMGGQVLFSADDGEHGLELWATDGTPEGTRLLRDIARGPFSSTPAAFTAAAGRILFTARDDAHGIELWQSDGTAAGTRLVHDVNPGPASSWPQSLTVAGGRLYFMADDGLAGRELWALPLSGPAACQPSERVLCLQGDRFRVEAAWRDFQLHNGAGTAVPITGDAGYFWFFSPSNAEVILKVLDGRSLNDHFWVFYGALSNVEYTLTVTDTQTGLTLRYLNPLGQLASVGDTTGFGPQGAFSVAPPSPPALVRRSKSPVSAVCEPGPQRLCLGGGRFSVEAAWKDFAGKTGAGKAVPLSADTGYFWFFDAANAEVVLKVLDGTTVNGKHWVFYGALSNVEYTLTVTDTQTGEVRVYSNPKGRFASVADTGAF
jgi:ELWxxDGT repeat protein